MGIATSGCRSPGPDKASGSAPSPAPVLRSSGDHSQPIRSPASRSPTKRRETSCKPLASRPSPPKRAWKASAIAASAKQNRINSCSPRCCRRPRQIRRRFVKAGRTSRVCVLIANGAPADFANHTARHTSQLGSRTRGTTNGSVDCSSTTLRDR